jgi:hypothetical protein
MALALGFLLCFLPCTLADTFISSKTHTQGIPGQEDKEDEGTTWLGKNKLRDDKDEMSFIVNLDQKKLYIVNHGKKNFSALDLPLDMMAMIPEDARAMMEQMASQMEMSVEITPTEETAEIAGFPARLTKVKVSNPMGMAMDIDMWMTDKAKIDLSAYKALYEEILSAQPMGAEWIKEIMAIDGFRVKQETRVKMMGTEFVTREELVSIAEKEAPAGTYEPPAGYTEEPFDIMSGLGHAGGGM